MRLIVEIPDEEFVTYKLAYDIGMHSGAIKRIVDGKMLPEGAEILTAEAYSDLCLRASRTPCYLDSPCEYQNEDVKIPCEERKTGKWIRHDTGHSIYYDCSLCSCLAKCTETADGFIWMLSKYCPDCGAEMKGSEGRCQIVVGQF